MTNNTSETESIPDSETLESMPDSETETISETDNDSMETQDESSHVFVRWLIEQIYMEQEEEPLSIKQFLKKMCKEISHYEELSSMMEDDPLYQKIKERAETYKEENSDIEVSDRAAYCYAVKEFKEILRDELRYYLNSRLSSEEEEENDDDNNSKKLDFTNAMAKWEQKMREHLSKP